MAAKPKVSLHVAPGAGHNVLEMSASAATRHFNPLLQAIVPGFALPMR